MILCAVRRPLCLFVQDSTGQVIGAQCRDLITGRRFEVHAKVVINATGVCGCAVSAAGACGCSLLLHAKLLRLVIALRRC